MEYEAIDSEELLSRMRTLNKKFKNACNQVILLNNQIEHLQVRYDRAVQCNKRSYRYFLRLRLATLEGIRNMFYEYACRRADQLDEMQDQLVQEGVIDSDYDMDEAESDTEAQWHGAGGQGDGTSDEESLQASDVLQIQAGGSQEASTLDSQPGPSSGFMWQAGSTSYTPSSEASLSNQGFSDEETFPIERPESPESLSEAVASDEALSTSGCISEDTEEAFRRVSPSKPGAAAKAISAIGHKLVNIGSSTSMAGGRLAGEQNSQKTNTSRLETSDLGAGNAASEHLSVNLHVNVGESKATVLKVRVSQDPADAPRQAKTARLNNNC